MVAAQNTGTDIHIGVVGCGLWGRNIARNCARLNVLRGVSDSDCQRAEEFATSFNCTATSFAELCSDPHLDGIMIAASAESHEELAVQALQAGKHVFIEKPMALTLASATAIRNVARQAERQIMTGHLIRYHPAFQELQKQIADGAIGTIRHIQANRLAMGRIRNTESVLFDLCPHDLSLILALTGAPPVTVSCHGAAHITPDMPDFLSTGLGFASGITAAMHTSWLSPVKEHRLLVTGQTGSLVFDDTKPWSEKLTLYSDNITQAGSLFVIERASPLTLPLEEAEPLQEEVKAFINVCATGAPALTDGDEGVRVQAVLEQMVTHFTSTNTSSGPADNATAKKESLNRK